MIGRGADLGLPASLQRAEAVGATPHRSFVLTPAAVFGHEVHTTEPNATQNDYYQNDRAGHTRYPILRTRNFHNTSIWPMVDSHHSPGGTPEYPISGDCI
jgi:hypothetical protein